MSALELRDVSKAYGAGAAEVHALAHIDLAVEPGTLVAVMGPSGSGKSSLLTIAGSLEEPSSGDVVVDGARLADLSRNDRARLRRQRIGFVFQEFNLLSGLTTAENVSLPLELDGVSARRARPAAREALDRLGLAGEADRFPDELSGGERQRVAIARATVGDRRLLLADEPTGALDSVNGETVMRMLRTACQDGVAGVVVTHDAQLASWADRIVFLRDGRLVDQTAPRPGPESLLRSDARWSAPARRAVGRWSVRLLRREWRSQVLVTALIAGSVGAAVFASTAAAHIAPSRDAEMGTADHRIETPVEDQAALDPYLAEAREWFGTIDVVLSSAATVPGVSDPVELRAHEADGAYSSAMVAVRSGRRPAAPDEVALTDELVDLLGAGVGDRVELGGVSRLVVGVVEDPADLDDEFALVDPAALPDPRTVTLLVRADPERARAFQPSAVPGRGLAEPRGHDESTTAALGVLVASTVALLLVSLVAAAAFITVAQRRQRQLGMLAAVGATDRHLRSAMLAHGLAVGLVAGLAGTVTGLATWVAVAGAVEGPAGHRIDRFAVPVGLVAAGPVLALVTATAAAWWPARAVARIPVVTALSGRPPAPRRARRSIVVGVVLVVAGLAGIAGGIDPVADAVVPPLLIAGLVAVGASTLFLAGPALRGVARLAGRLPVGVRIPARDLARAEGRASAALGAVSLALGLAVAVVLLAAAAEPGRDRGNLAPDQLAVWTTPTEAGRLQVPQVPAADVGRLDGVADRIAAAVATDGGDAPTVVPVDVAVAAAPAGRSGGVVQLSVAVLGRPVGGGTIRDSGRIFVATPELLRHLGVDETSIAADTLLLTTQPGPVSIAGDLAGVASRREPVPPGQVELIDLPDHSSAPRTVITEAGLAALDLTAQRAGWLVEADRPIDGAAVGRARALAADEGLSVEGRDNSSGLGALRTAATAMGAGLALGIVALTLGLVRSEGARDARTLDAIGASGRTRRQVEATTAGLLTGIGVVLGASVAAAAVVAGYWGRTDRLAHVPAAHLAALVLGLPVVSVAASWLAAGDPTRRGRVPASP